MKRINGFLIFTMYPLSLASLIHLFFEINTQSILATLLFLILSFLINLLNTEYLNSTNRKAILKTFHTQSLDTFCQIIPSEEYTKIFSAFEKHNVLKPIRGFIKTNDETLLKHFGSQAKWLYVLKQKPNNEIVFSSAKVYIFPDAPDIVFINDYPKDIFREYDLFHEIAHTSIASLFVNHFYSQQFFQWVILLSLSLIDDFGNLPSIVCAIFASTYPLLKLINYWENDIELVTDFNAYMMMKSKGYSNEQLLPLKRLHENKYEIVLENTKYNPSIKNFFLLNYTAMRKNLIEMVVNNKMDFSSVKSAAVLIRNKWTPLLKLAAITYVAIHLSYDRNILIALEVFVAIFFVYYFTDRKSVV